MTRLEDVRATRRSDSNPLAPFHPAVRALFTSVFARPTRSQALGWSSIARGDSPLILAPTGSGKTLEAFPWCLDRLMFAPAAAGEPAMPRVEVVWVGVESLGEGGDRVALYLADHLARLLPPKQDAHSAGPLDPRPHGRPGDIRVRSETDRETAIIDYLRSHGASFFWPLHEAVGGGYPAETVTALWNLVWQSVVSNDTSHAVRTFINAHAPRRRAHRSDRPTFRSRRLVPPAAEGRWNLAWPRTADLKVRTTSADVAQVFRPAKADATSRQDFSQARWVFRPRSHPSTVNARRNCRTSDEGCDYLPPGDLGLWQATAP